MCKIKKKKQKEFAILFSLKESLVKCDNSLIKLSFNRIEIKFNNGTPFYKDYKLSFSTLNENACSIKGLFIGFNCI